MSNDLMTALARIAGGERSKADAAETPFRKGLHEARANTMEQAAARIAALEAERDRLREALKPFAKMGETFVRDYPNAIKLERTLAPVNGPAVSATVRVKHFQNATRVWEAGQ